MILITSNTWRTQHRPERCFEVYGLALEGSQTYLVAPDFPVRLVSLGTHRQPGLLSAAYWLQSAPAPPTTTGQRVLADLAPRHERWVLVSVLFDGRQDPSSPALPSCPTLCTTQWHVFSGPRKI